MNNEVVSLENGDFEVRPLKTSQERFLQLLREQRYAAAQRNDGAVVESLDIEIAHQLKKGS